MTQAAIRLREAKEANDPEMMRAAVRLNWQLWTIIQSELLAPDCQLPTDLRQNALSLAAFIDRHSMKVIPDPEPAKLDVLININRELAGGLYQTPPDAENGSEKQDHPPAEPAPGLTDTSA